MPLNKFTFMDEFSIIFQVAILNFIIYSQRGHEQFKSGDAYTLKWRKGDFKTVHEISIFVESDNICI